MKLIIALFLFVHFYFPTFCLSNDNSEFKILTLLKDTNYKSQSEAIELLKNLNKPGETIIQSVFHTLKKPNLKKIFSDNYCKLIVKWGRLSMPFLIQALNNKSDFNHQRAPGLILKIAQERDPKIIIPAIPGLIECIKEKDFEEKEEALWALASLKELADDAVTVLTEEMISSKDTDIHWSCDIAEALVEIAGNDYPPIQPFLKKNLENLQQYVNEVDDRKFKLERGFDISWIKFKKEKTEHHLLVSSSAFYPYRKIKYRNIIYDIAIDKNKIKFISTSDINFMTDDGFMIGDTVKKLKESGYSEFNEMRGWGYWVKLESGWCAAFCEGDACTDKELNIDSKIKWFFK